MPAEPKAQHCEICGEYLGTYVKPWGSHDTCGSIECDREARDIEREEEAGREERARDDGFSRY